MTLAHTLTKMFPTDDLVGINLILTDDERPDLGEGVHVVINKTFRANIPSDGDMTTKIQQDLGKEAQAAIDKYVRLVTRFNNPAYQTKVDQISNNLTLQVI